jgi:hypothetical protein
MQQTTRNSGVIETATSMSIDYQISNATRATNGSPVLLGKRQVTVALLC